MQTVDALQSALHLVLSGAGVSLPGVFLLQGHVVEIEAAFTTDAQEVVVGPIQQLRVKIVSHPVDLVLADGLDGPSDGWSVSYPGLSPLVLLDRVLPQWFILQQGLLQL